MANRRPAQNVIAFAHLCELLNSRPPRSQDWFREQIGVGQTTMTKFMRILRNRKLIYVALWTTGGKRISTRIAMWTWGYNREDAPRPTPVPRKIIDRNNKRKRAERKRNEVRKELVKVAGESFACERGADVRGDSLAHH